MPDLDIKYFSTAGAFTRNLYRNYGLNLVLGWFKREEVQVMLFIFPLASPDQFFEMDNKAVDRLNDNECAEDKH